MKKMIVTFAFILLIITGCSGGGGGEEYDEIGTTSTPETNSINLNDTGIEWSGSASSGNANTCDAAHSAGQDCQHGRDARAAAGTLSKVGSGTAGFDFTKISNSGSELPASATLGYGPNAWACTRDNTTGLIWEVKENSGPHMRFQNHKYLWYDPNSPDGYLGGFENTETCNNTLGEQNCNIYNYTVAVNSRGLCGFDDWRMPTWRELQGIVNYGRHGPSIDTMYFPNTSSVFWTGSPFVGTVFSAWVVDFDNGRVGYDSQASVNHVRLVRGEQ